MNPFKFQTVPSLVVEFGAARRIGAILRERYTQSRLCLVTDGFLHKSGLLAPALASLAALPELRVLSNSQITSLPEINHYSNVIATLLAFDNDIAAGSPSAPLAQTVTSIEALAQVEEQTSQQRAVLFAALIEGKPEPGALTAIIGAQSSQQSAQSSFGKVAGNLPSFTPNGTQQDAQASFGKVPDNLPVFAPNGNLSPLVSEAQQFNDIGA